MTDHNDKGGHTMEPGGLSLEIKTVKFPDKIEQKPFMLETTTLKEIDKINETMALCH